jgi:hypothetical protein
MVPFQTSGSDLQKAYAWAAWQFLTQYVPESKRETSGDQIQIGINQLSHEAQKRLRALIQDWKKASKSQDADQDDRRGRLEREESVASSLADGGPNSDSESDDIGGALKEPSAAPSLMPKDSELVFDREMSLQVIDDAEALPDEQVTVSNLDAWGAADAELAEESDKLADTEAAAEDGWSTARQEKLEKEKREQERKSQEAAMAAAQVPLSPITIATHDALQAHDSPCAPSELRYSACVKLRGQLSWLLRLSVLGRNVMPKLNERKKRSVKRLKKSERALKPSVNVIARQGRIWNKRWISMKSGAMKSSWQ